MTTRLDEPPPPVTSSTGGDWNGRDWVELLRVRDDIEAHLLWGRLSEVGIETRRVKDRSAPGAWMYGGSNPWAPVAVLVRRFQFDDARVVLAEISWSSPDFASAPVARDDRGRRRALLWWAAAIVVGVILTSIGMIRTAETLGACNVPAVCGGPSGTSP